MHSLAAPDEAVLIGNRFEYIKEAPDIKSEALNKLAFGKEVVVLQQTAPLWPHLSAVNNTWLPWASKNGVREMLRSRSVAIERAETWLNRLGIDASVWRRKPQSLSGGERQRVALASILMFDAQCILLDEPTSALDQSSVRLIVQVIEEQAKQGKLVIIASHDADLLSISSWRHLSIVESFDSKSKFRLVEAGL
jgi:histidine transport system ATP-binding protein